MGRRDNYIVAIEKNLRLYERIAKSRIEILAGAVWSHNDGLEFSTEGNMGSSAASLVGRQRGAIRKVPSFTLGAIAAKFDLAKVDFIKCDIEGAESVIFEDLAFLNRFSPKIIIEAHMIGGVATTGKFKGDLGKAGYRFKEIPQIGGALPLIECYPR